MIITCVLNFIKHTNTRIIKARATADDDVLNTYTYTHDNYFNFLLYVPKANAKVQNAKYKIR